jgi:tetratricopeptide (TPR) repeat protein
VTLAYLLSMALAAAAPAEKGPADGAGAPVAAQAAARQVSARAIGHYLAARRAQAEVDIERAEEELRQALVFDELSPWLRVAHGEVLARMARWDEGEAEARRAVALDPEGESGEAGWLLLGRIFAYRREPARAIEALRVAATLEAQRARALPPAEERTPDAEPWRLLGRVLFESGDVEGAAKAMDELGAMLPAEAARGYREMANGSLAVQEAARADRFLRRAVELLPGDLEAWKLLGRLEERGRRLPEARAAWEAALRAEPEDIDALAALGRISLRLGDAAGAQLYFRQLRLVDSDDAGAVAASAMALVEARQAEEALRLLDGWAGVADGRIHFARGLALEDLRRWLEAARAFEQVPPNGELWGAARAALAWALVRAGRVDEALETADRALAVKPGEVRLLLARAAVLERAGRVGDAAEWLAGAVAGREKAGDDAGAADLYDALGAALAKAGRPAEAVALLARALERRPKDEALLFALGQAEERAGNTESALERMRALLAINPDHAEALNFVGYSYAEKGVRLDEAERLIGHALELRPDSGFFLDSIGWVYFRKGDYARATAALERADALAGPEPTILEHLGDAYRGARRAREAEQAYRRALGSLEAGESQDGPERAAAQRASIEGKLRELAASAPAPASAPQPPPAR